MGSFIQAFVSFRTAYNDAAGVEVIIQCLAFAQKLWRENDVFAIHFLAYAFCITDRNRTFDNHDSVWIDAFYQLNNFFYVAGIEVILYRVIVRGSSDNDKVCIAICPGTVKRSRQVQFLFREIFLDIFILNGRFTLINQAYLFRNNVYSCNLMVLAQQCGDA